MGCGSSVGAAGGTKKLTSAIRWHDAENDDRLDTIHGLMRFVNTKDEVTGNVAIHIAAQNGKVDVVDYLLKNGAQVNSQNFKGNTALHMSVEYNLEDTTRKLLELGADKTIKNYDGNAAETGIDGGKNLPESIVQVSP